MAAKGWGDLFILSLPYLMIAGLFLGISFRGLIYYSMKRHEWFIKEFEKRVNHHLDSDLIESKEGNSFVGQVRKILEKTYYESFDVRSKLQRRSSDKVMSLTDRLFMIRQGSAWMIKDLLKQIKHIKWHDEPPKLISITKAAYGQNPYFSKLMGVFSISSANDLVGILPGMFVVGGILGTFVGISKGLPELSTMNVTDIENSKLVMDRFLHEVSFAMQSSIFGITCSIIMNVFNTWFSPERIYASMNNRFENVLEVLWHSSTNNHYEKKSKGLDKKIEKDSQELLEQQYDNVEHLRVDKEESEINKKRA